MGKDEVFKGEIEKASDFKFGANVAKVFDDMVNRSVPYYGEIQRMMAELAADYAKEGSDVYDLGCSTGTTIIGMDTMINPIIRFIGVDDSQEMLDKCKSKLMEIGFSREYELHCADLNQGVKITNASVVVLCLTLQFVRPIYREQLLKNIFSGLNSGGVLILVEKILAEDSLFNRDFIDYYYWINTQEKYDGCEIKEIKIGDNEATCQLRFFYDSKDSNGKHYEDNFICILNLKKCDDKWLIDSIDKDIK